jgi:hypothetical protein
MTVTTAGGMRAIKLTQEIRGHEGVDWAVNDVINNGNVWALLKVIINANRKSFHAKKNESRKADANPGAAKGKMILRILAKFEYPSMAAAYSSSTGIDAMNVFNKYTVSGRFIDV